MDDGGMRYWQEQGQNESRDNMDTPKVYGCIAKVIAALAKEGISKSRDNKIQGYKFRGIDDVYNALAPFLADAGLCVVPRYTERTVVERESQKGGALFYVTVIGSYDLVAVADGSKVTVGPFYGEAMDSGDKATNKAMSASFKYMAMQTFVIPTEGDNDADATTHEVASKRQTMGTGEFAKHKQAIGEAQDEMALRKAFTTAYVSAQKMGDHDAESRFTDLKDIRKQELADAAFMAKQAGKAPTHAEPDIPQ